MLLVDEMLKNVKICEFVNHCPSVSEKVWCVKMTEMGDLMMALSRKKKQEAKAEELKNEVKLLKRRHDATLDRERKLKEDINSGELKPATAYRLPLSTLPPTFNSLNSESSTLAKEDLGVLRRTALAK